MQKHRQQIRNGLLTVGLNREAFLKEWGMPDKTYPISSDEVTKFSALWGSNLGGAGFFKGKVPLDVWEYREKEVTLIFNGVELISWKTEKTTKELEKQSSKRTEKTRKESEKESPKETEGTTKELEVRSTKKIGENDVFINRNNTAVGRKYYHRSGCRTISNSGPYLNRLTVEEAVKRGYEPCSICNPQ